MGGAEGSGDPGREAGASGKVLVRGTYKLQPLVSRDWKVLDNIGGGVGAGLQHILQTRRLHPRCCGRSGHRVAGWVSLPPPPLHGPLSLRKKVSRGSGRSMSALGSSCGRRPPTWLAGDWGTWATWSIFRDDSSGDRGMCVWGPQEYPRTTPHPSPPTSRDHPKETADQEPTPLPKEALGSTPVYREM